jgi:toxin ParE1/3/4
MDDRIQSHVEMLDKFPQLGRPGRIEDTRELVIPHTPYIATYRISSTTVRILRVLHGAQQWPNDIP